MTTRKKDKERLLLTRFLKSMGEDPGRWPIEEETERPDFVVRSPSGSRIGVEVTELLTPDQGKDRAADNRVAAVVQETVSKFLVSLGGSGGAIVDGTTKNLPQREPLGLEKAIHSHLAANGAALTNDKGLLDVPLCHDWGEIQFVERCDSLREVLLLESEFPPPLSYKSPKPLPEIETALLDTIEKKVRAARSYRQGLKLWLAIRNPYQRLRSVRPEITKQTQQINQGAFARIVLFNLRQDVRDPCSPRPRFLDLLPG